jgi:hypothetical protein
LEEKKRRKEEMVRIKKENELKLLKQSIDDELIKQVELLEDINDLNVYDINGFHQKGKKYGIYELNQLHYWEAVLVRLQ